MNTYIRNLAGQTSTTFLGVIGFTLVIAGLSLSAIASINRDVPFNAALRGPACELRMTDMNGDNHIIARGNAGEACQDMVERLGLKMSDMPASYRAIWFELAPGE